MKRRGDQLIEQICDGADDAAANELLNEFFRGYPVDNLRTLLCSSKPSAAGAGTWIASELGERTAPLLPDIVKLLDHPRRYVRFFALDAVLLAATSGNGEAIAKSILLILDPEDAVCWKALCFLAHATSDQLRESYQYIQDVAVRTHLTWLLDSEGGSNISEIVENVDDDDCLRRLFAAAAAARVARTDPVPLTHAATSSDRRVSSFAKEELELLNRRQGLS